MSDARGRLRRLLSVWQMSVPATLLIPRGMQGVLPCSPNTVNTGAHNTIDASEARGGALPHLSGMGVDGAHNTVGKMLAPTTLLAFCHVREVVEYYPAGIQGTFLGIVVDLSALPYFLHPFPSPYRAGVPGRLVLVGSDCARWRRAISRGSAHP